MGVLFKIAYRNLREHKTKTFIIGSLIAIGMMILVVGNSVLDTATAGIKANYTENYTGHVIIAASGVEAPSLTPDGAMQGVEQGTPSIPDYTYIAQINNNILYLHIHNTGTSNSRQYPSPVGIAGEKCCFHQR